MKDLKNNVFNSPLSGIFRHEQKGPLWFLKSLHNVMLSVNPGRIHSYTNEVA